MYIGSVSDRASLSFADVNMMGMRLTRFCIYTIVKHYTLMDVQGHGHEHVCSHQTLITTNMYIGEEQNTVQSSSSRKERASE